MKVVLEVKTLGEPKENCVIAYKKGEWVAMPREQFLSYAVNGQRLLNKSHEERLAKIERDLVKLAKIIKEKK